MSAVWLARDFLRTAGRPIDIAPCGCSTTDCPPITEGAPMTTETPTTIEVTMEDFLRAARIHTVKAIDPATPREEFATHCALGHAYSLVAYLLEAHLATGDDTTELAWELHEFAEDGEPLAHWVSDQVRARGINTEPA